MPSPSSSTSPTTAPATLYDVLGVPKTATAAEIRRAFREGARQHHPDVGGDENKFRAIALAHEVLTDPDKRERYDRTGMLAPMRAAPIVTRKHKYVLTGLRVDGDLANLLYAVDETGAPRVLKSPRECRDNELIDREAAVLAKLAASPKAVRYVPRLVETFDSRSASGGERRRVNVFDNQNCDNWHSFVDVRARMPKLEIEHAAWMFNRVLEGLAAAHAEGIIHGAVLPHNLLAFSMASGDGSEWDHGVQLTDWCCSVDRGKPLRIVAPEWREFYPPEVFAKKGATPATDIYMAAKSISYVLGGSKTSLPVHVPNYFANFLRWCVMGNTAARPNDARHVRREFEEHMRENYGPKRYVKFVLPAAN
jgi:serine/threonine protein kinase